MKIEIPVRAISVNAVWQGRRFKTKEYKDYEQDTLWFLNKMGRVNGMVQIDYKFFFAGRMLDTDNGIKPIQDILVKAGIIQNDSMVMRITAEKFRAKENKIVIEILPFNSL